MRKYIILLSILLIFLLASTPNIPIIVIKNVTIIDVITGKTKPEMTILIENNHIRRIGKSGEITYPAYANVIDGSNKYVIPGLWDMHVHLYSSEATLPLFVLNGITSVRDMGSNLQKTSEFIRRINNGELIGPRIKTAGYMIESRQWIDQYLKLLKEWGASEEHIKEFLSTRITAANTLESIAIVDSLASLGVDFIKIRHAPSKEAYFEITKRAKEKNLKLAGHYLWIVSLQETSEAGQTSIEHGVFPGFYNQSIDSKKDIFKSLITNNTHLVPTLVAMAKEKKSDDQLLILINDEAGKIDYRNKYVEHSTRKNWLEQFQLNQMDKERPSVEILRDMLDQSNKFIKEAFEAGVPVMAGTDAPITSIVSGFSLHDELRLLVEELSLSPLEALQSASIIPATFFGNEKELGSIDAGKLADLLILNSDPLTDIANTRDIHSVIYNGKIFNRNTIDEHLQLIRNKIKEK